MSSNPEDRRREAAEKALLQRYQAAVSAFEKRLAEARRIGMQRIEDRSAAAVARLEARLEARRTAGLDRLRTRYEKAHAKHQTRHEAAAERRRKRREAAEERRQARAAKRKGTPRVRKVAAKKAVAAREELAAMRLEDIDLILPPSKGGRLKIGSSFDPEGETKAGRARRKKAVVEVAKDLMAGQGDGRLSQDDRALLHAVEEGLMSKADVKELQSLRRLTKEEAARAAIRSGRRRARSSVVAATSAANRASKFSYHRRELPKPESKKRTKVAVASALRLARARDEHAAAISRDRQRLREIESLQRSIAEEDQTAKWTSLPEVVRANARARSAELLRAWSDIASQFETDVGRQMKHLPPKKRSEAELRELGGLDYMPPKRKSWG